MGLFDFLKRDVRTKETGSSCKGTGIYHRPGDEYNYSCDYYCADCGGDGQPTTKTIKLSSFGPPYSKTVANPGRPGRGYVWKKAHSIEGRT